MAEGRAEVRCHGCGRDFLVTPAGSGQVAECPWCGGWLDVAPATPAPQPGPDDGPGPGLPVNPSEFEQAQREPTFPASRLDLLLDRMETVLCRWGRLAERMDRAIGRADLGGDSPLEEEVREREVRGRERDHRA